MVLTILIETSLIIMTIYQWYFILVLSRVERCLKFLQFLRLIEGGVKLLCILNKSRYSSLIYRIDLGWNLLYFEKKFRVFLKSNNREHFSKSKRKFRVFLYIYVTHKISKFWSANNGKGRKIMQTKRLSNILFRCQIQNDMKEIFN